MDLFTKAGPLCDNGVVTKKNPMWHGTDYSCTGSAHYAGEHIYCTSAAHHQNPMSWFPVKRYRPEFQVGVAYMPFDSEGQDIIVVDGHGGRKAFIYANKWESAADGWMLD